MVMGPPFGRQRYGRGSGPITSHPRLGGFLNHLRKAGSLIVGLDCEEDEVA